MKSELEQFLSLPLGRRTPLNQLELSSVRALMAYAASNQNVHQSVIEEAVSDQFGVKDVTEIQSLSYDDVIRFLIDLQVDLILN